MGLFKPDFFRSLTVGFALGALVVFTQLGGDVGAGLVPSAIAAPAR